MADSEANNKDPQRPRFEDAMGELEQIVHDLEEGELGLEEALARYEQGVKRLRECHELLEQTERKIELLAGVDAAGNPATQPFDEESTAENAPASEPRKRAASTPKRRKREAPIDEPPALF